MGIQVYTPIGPIKNQIDQEHASIDLKTLTSTVETQQELSENTLLVIQANSELVKAFLEALS